MSHLPPVLDTAIETSPLQLDMGMDKNMGRTVSVKPGSSHSNHTVTGSRKDEPVYSPPTVTPGPNETPIANLYSTPSSSALSFHTDANSQPLHSHSKSNSSQVSLASSTASFNHLSMALPEDETVEDGGWAESVLAAADTDGSWSAKNVMKFFGGGH
jgi:hypothetical protein